MKHTKLFLMVILALLALTLLRPETPATPATLPALLAETWAFYKERFLVNGERVASNHYGGTITEGQSYALLKAVWMDDQVTFDKVWTWTRRHMSRPSDHLFAWRWGETPEGKNGIAETVTATDADQDIAYALLLAGEKWKDPAYTKAAESIIGDLWRLNAVSIRGRYYLAPGTWEGFREEYLTINPSYFAPYAYRKFAAHDPAHAEGWRQLAADIYPTLEACSDLTANKLPPNWCAVNWETGTIGFSDRQGEGSRNFSYDAFRVFWRMALDARLDDSGGTGQAREYLKTRTALQDYWQAHQTLPEGFGSDSRPLGNAPSGFALASLLAQRPFLGNPSPGPQTWDRHYAQLLAPHYHPEGYWFNDYNDFLHSVIWFHLYTLSL